MHSSARSSTDSSTLHPNSTEGGLSPAVQLASPSDMVGPSPVTSNGTETTDIEDDIAEEVATKPEPAKETEPPVRHHLCDLAWLLLIPS